MMSPRTFGSRDRLAILASLVVALMVAATDFLTTRHVNPSMNYVVAIAALAWTRSTRAVWLLSGIYLLLSALPPFVQARSDAAPAGFVWVNRFFTAMAMVATAGLVTVWIRSQLTLEESQRTLEQQNEELAAREEEIARQNEELQAQTEELERQSEEMQLSNDELARHEQVLQALLDLSRALTAGLGQSKSMDLICEALAQLVDEEAVAAAILERRDDRVALRCHYGFGPDGVVQKEWPLAHAFAHLVIERNQTAYIEDVSLRPDLMIPEPRSGPRFRSVLSAPLRVRGRAVGSVEVYSHRPQAWTEDQVALVESLAAQASISLESAELFEEIDQQRRRLDAVFLTLPIGVAVADVAYTDVRLNAAGAAMLNLPTDANLARPDLPRTWEVYREGRLALPEEMPLRRAVRNGEIIDKEEMELVFAGGRRLVVQVSAGPIRSREGEIIGAVEAFTDITAQKQQQRELEARRREAEENAVRKTRFLAAVSHDIRTPANAINLIAELIGRTAVDPALTGQVPQLAFELKQNARSLVELVSDVLDVARFDAGKVELQESEFSLAALFADEGRQLLPLARESGLLLEIEMPQPPVWLRTDRIKLGRVISNLVGNAIKFTRAGYVHLGAELRPYGGVQIVVRDTGIGIAPEQVDRIFDEFYQLRNPERDRNKGSGLGLAICKRIVDAMGGSISVNSTPGRGSTFTVVLPASCMAQRSAEAIAEEPMIAASADHATGRRSLAGLRVLVVEDHQSTRLAAARILATEGATVLEAPDGRTAMRMLRDEAPDVLLLDLMLPDMDGREILRTLRVERPSSLDHILVLTGDLISSTAEDMRAMGADGLCPKPINIPLLLSTLAGQAGSDGQAAGADGDGRASKPADNGPYEGR